MEQEIWKDIPKFESYQASNLGRVKSFKWNKIEGIIKQPSKNGKGYLQVHLSVKGKKKVCSVHQLIAKTFLPNPENKYSVNHRDGCKENNAVENLEWSTREEQYQHAKEMGLNTQYAKHPKKVIQKTLNDDVVTVHDSTRAAARYINATPAGIQAACKGINKTCKGFKWIFCD